MDYGDIYLIKEKVEKLSKGIDPQTNLPFPQDTILNSQNNKSLFKSISLILDDVLKVGGKFERVDKRTKYPFYITPEQISGIDLSSSPIAISAFVYSINNQISTEHMKKLRAAQVTSWLMENGYLTEIEHDDGKKFKVLTAKSKTIGMTSERKINAYGREYDINLYCTEAQKFILTHLNEITK